MATEHAPRHEPGLEAAYHAGLEPVVQHFPEVAYQQHLYPQHHHQNQYADAPLPKPDPLSSSVPPFSGVPRTFTSADPPPPGKRHRVCGCSLLVFLLAVIIAILSAAVIGLAAATGIEANQASDATAQVAALTASLAAAAPASTTAPISAIDAGCSANEKAVTGTNYTAFKVLGALRYTLYCNRDSKPAPLLSLFTPDFETCMDACAAYTRYIPESFGTGANTTCGAVTFIPAWTDKSVAFDGRAPGNCYLKPTVNAASLMVSTIGVDCHSAVYAPGT
ncbi:hypothetical protein B0T18DRAFT_387255 [Schizothecium vesticola]|uniref:Uncharacterized protein n=1 Tax=Schizothecium vesticola TaxID=314040 RepID=A0AA40K9I4_9PEZI|nr:hypothetical protein B0T18DRAFT_387255 [Schizothecium vesticola]